MEPSILSKNKLFNITDVIKQNNYMENEYQSFTKFVQNTIKCEKNGKTIDKKIINQAYNIILHKESSGFNGESLEINIETLDDFFLMAKDANVNMLMPTNTNIYLASYYNNFDNFPVARVYVYTLKQIDELELILDRNKQEHIDLTTKDHNKLIDKKNVNNRLNDYLQHKEKRYEKINKFTKGRIKNTSQSGGVAFVNEEGNCVICNQELKNIEIENISFYGAGEYSNIQFTMEVCSSCLSKEAENNILLKSIFEVSGLKECLNKKNVSIEEIRKFSNIIVEYYLNAKILKYSNKEEDEIHAITKSGLRLILRITDIDSYGYNIKSKEDIELVRFDSANDHPDKVEFMPHHVHNNLVEENILKRIIDKFRRNKKKRKKLRESFNNDVDITDSFLTGFLGFDYVSIKKKIDKIEKESS